jgi:hypothetical protein
MKPTSVIALAASLALPVIACSSTPPTPVSGGALFVTQSPQPAGSASTTGLACQQGSNKFYVAQIAPPSSGYDYDTVQDGTDGASVQCKTNANSFSVSVSYNKSTFIASGTYSLGTPDAKTGQQSGTATGVNVSIVMGGSLYKAVSPPGCEMKITHRTDPATDGQFAGYFSCPQLVDTSNPNDACGVNFDASGMPQNLANSAQFQFLNCGSL